MNENNKNQATFRFLSAPLNSRRPGKCIQNLWEINCVLKIFTGHQVEQWTVSKCKYPKYCMKVSLAVLLAKRSQPVKAQMEMPGIKWKIARKYITHRTKSQTIILACQPSNINYMRMISTNQT